MGRHAVVQSHMEVLMKQVLSLEELIVSPQDEVVVSTRNGNYSVRVRQRPEPHIEVYSVLVSDVEADPGLYEALNEINRRLSHCRVFWYRDNVVLAGELVGISATREALSCLCDEVAEHVDSDAAELHTVFGGTTYEKEDE